MQSWNRLAQIAVAEEAYVAAEMDRLELVCRRSRMDPNEYQRDLDAAWRRSVEALESLTALRNAEASARLTEELEPA